MDGVISFGEVKHAALYFDRVLLFPLSGFRVSEDGNFVIRTPSCDVPFSAFTNLVTGETRPDSSLRMDDEMIRFFQGAAYLYHTMYPLVIDDLRQAGHDFSPIWFDAGPPAERAAGTMIDAVTRALQDGASIPLHGSVREIFSNFARLYGFDRSDILLERTTIHDCGEESSPVLTISQLPMVDTSRLTWAEIIELRCDKEAQTKLKRLRAFLTENYSGKSAAFIEDDLGRRMGDYEFAAKKHGFDMVTGAISVLLDAKTLQASVSAGIGAALFGGVIAGVSTGAVVEIARVTLEIAQRRHEASRWKHSHELGYLIDLHSIVGNRQTRG